MILAGVSINLVVGQNGLITRAKEAKKRTEEAQLKEKYSFDDIDEYIKSLQGELIVEQVNDEYPGDISDNNTRDGSEEKPYVVNSIEDLVEFASNVRNGETYENKYIMLGINLDFSSSKSYMEPYRTDYGKYGYDGELKELLTSGEGFLTIGSTTDSTNSFCGTFDGNGKIINNLYMNKFTYSNGDFLIGLFCNNNGIIKNLGLNNVYIKGETMGTSGTLMVGGITAYNRRGEINSCYVTGNIMGKAQNTDVRLGGIAGNGHKIITKCYSVVKIVDEASNRISLGGIIGAGNAEISNSFTIMDADVVRASSGNIGGVAEGGKGSLSNCFSITKINVESEIDWLNVGGICGAGNNDIINCFAIIESINASNKAIIGNMVGVQTTGTITGGYYSNNDYEAIKLIKGGENTIDKLQENELPSMLEVIGEGFKNDTNNINNGYPVLVWQN